MTPTLQHSQRRLTRKRIERMAAHAVPWAGPRYEADPIVPLRRCPHDCYLPEGQTIAQDVNGCAYCSGCHWPERVERRRGDSLLYTAMPVLDRRCQPIDGSLQADRTNLPSWRLDNTWSLSDDHNSPSPILKHAYEGYDAWRLKDFPITEEAKRNFRRLLTWYKDQRSKLKAKYVLKEGKIVSIPHKWPEVSTPTEIAALLDRFLACQVRFFEGRQKKHVFWKRTQQSAPLKLFAPTPWPFTSWVKPSTVIPLGAFPVKREQAGFQTKNGISRDGVQPRFDNFCSKCFTRSPITKHIEGGFRPERRELVRKVMTEDAQRHGDCFVRVCGKGLDSRWVTNRIFTRQEIRRGLYVPQIHACGERAEA